ncbi:type I restriction-modification system subunit M [Luteolibacter ambystomatis]|uniref:site-specific DNA-methyltransferase (adenine-specific) n=1 Tax=Luteolibacter ambystomatis TaxID=2824561 RepID=A0A975IZY3_9BACT|nr:type I restriction-modification system subunit M [Luteolibacter ambystomatis]QUE50775.1 type I restriction-modification system subunit M [Luteolibacter ambystomatis]
MPPSDSQSFLRDLDKKLWTAADKLRSNLDAAVYKHAVLGLIFLKYVSDSFAQRQAEIEAMLKDPENDFFVDPAGYDQPAKYDEAIHQELEERDYYIEKNVFWVPALARWQTLQDSAKLPAGTEITVKNGKTTTYKITSTGKLIDDALEAVEKENPKLKNVLNKNYTQLQIDPANLAGLIDLIATIPFQHADLHAKDILGHVYEYFLGQFALAEGKKGGQYFTPKSIVSLIVEMIEPYQGRVYDPAMGSGGFFVQSERFIEEHGGTIGDIMVFGQESNPTTWRLAAMNMAIRGIDFDFGKEPADTFTRDQHPDLRADFVMANPPFNVKEWWNSKLADDVRWKYGTPPKGNANFAWIQHMLHHLAPNGIASFVLANGSMSANQSGEGDIRRRLIEADIVDCMVQLPSQLFYSTSIPVCIWCLAKNKGASKKRGTERRGETLFIDARRLGRMVDRVHKEFTDEDIAMVAGAYRRWRGSDEGEEEYRDIPGFCSSATLKEIEFHKFALVPGRYVGFSAEEKPDLTHIDLKTELEALAARLEQITISATQASQTLYSFANGSTPI